MSDDWQAVEAGIAIHPDEPTDVMVTLEQSALAALARLREREAQGERNEADLLASYNQRQADAMRYATEARAAEARVARLEEALREIVEKGAYHVSGDIARRALAHEEKA